MIIQVLLCPQNSLINFIIGQFSWEICQSRNILLFVIPLGTLVGIRSSPWTVLVSLYYRVSRANSRLFSRLTAVDYAPSRQWSWSWWLWWWWGGGDVDGNNQVMPIIVIVNNTKPNFFSHLFWLPWIDRSSSATATMLQLDWYSDLRSRMLLMLAEEKGELGFHRRCETRSSTVFRWSSIKWIS